MIVTASDNSEVVQRPKRLTRTIFGCVGTVLMLGGGASLAMWVLVDRNFATIGVFAAAAAILGLGLILASARTSLWVSTRRVAAPARDLSLDGRLLALEVKRNPVSLHQAFVFWQALHDPPARYSRISETVEQGTRSFRVSTSISIRTNDLGDETHAVPVALFTRGRLEHGLSFEATGRVSSLSHLEAVAYASAVVTRFVDAAGRKARSAYTAQPPGCPSLKDRVIEVLSSPIEGGEKDVDTISDAIAGLRAPAKKQDMLYAAATVVAYLAEQYPVCIRMTGSESDASARVTMERVTFPRRTEYTHPVSGVRRSLERLRKRVVDFQRNVFGVTPHTVDYPTQMAARTASYHLNIRGPEGFYLAHQELRDDINEGRTLGTAKLSELEYAMNRRQGQRTGHLYVRNGEKFSNLLYSCAFYERMPGSLSTAFVGAATTTLVACILAWSVLFTATEQIGLLQILLAFPLALTATSSSRSGAPFWGGDLRARWTTIITVIVLISALIASTIGTSLPHEAQEQLWAWLGVVAVGNTVVCAVFWISRALTHHEFLTR